MVRADRLDGDGRSHRPALPPSAGDLLDPLPRRFRVADRLGSDRGDALSRDSFGPQTPAHHDVREEARLHRRVPSVQVEGWIRLRETETLRRRDAFLVRPARLDFGEDEVTRAVQDSF